MCSYLLNFWYQKIERPNSLVVSCQDDKSKSREAPSGHLAAAHSWQWPQVSSIVLDVFLLSNLKQGSLLSCWEVSASVCKLSVRVSLPLSLPFSSPLSPPSLYLSEILLMKSFDTGTPQLPDFLLFCQKQNPNRNIKTCDLLSNAVCCSVLQCVAVCCSVSQCVIERFPEQWMKSSLLDALRVRRISLSMSPQD